MPEWVVPVIALLGPVGTAVGGWLIVRRFNQLGGGEAQTKVNALHKELVDAYEEKLKLRDEDFAECKARLEKVERELRSVKQRRADDRQEVHELRNLVTKLTHEMRKAAE